MSEAGAWLRGCVVVRGADAPTHAHLPCGVCTPSHAGVRGSCRGLRVHVLALLLLLVWECVWLLLAACEGTSGLCGPCC